MFWNLPGAQRYLLAAAESLRNSRHLLLVLPDPRRRDSPVPNLVERFRIWGDGELTPLHCSPEATEPIEWVAEQFGMPRHECANEEELLTCAQAPSRFVMIEGIPDEGDAARGWARFFTRIAESAQGLDGALLVFGGIVGPRFRLPPRNVRLEVAEFWGQLSDVDTELVIEESLRRFPPRSAALRCWARCLCRGFAIGDPELTATLVERLPQDPEAVAAVIRDVRPLDGAVAIANIHDAPEPLVAHGEPEPPRNGSDRDLWARGLLDWQESRGYNISSAVFGSPTDGEFARRFWAGQQEVLLPLVERVRVEACTALRRGFGERWAETLCPDEPLSVEWVRNEIGGLARLVTRSSLRGRLSRSLTASICRWRDIRNNLAHGDCVTLRELETAFEAYRVFATQRKSCAEGERQRA